jgi:dihydrofolate reductase
MITLIWAMDQNRLIGSKQSLPWHIKDDLLFFKSITHQKRVLMGMQTYRSMKQYFKDKPFPYEEVFVLSRQPVSLPDAEVIHNIEAFIRSNDQPLYVLGGSQIYDIMMRYADMLYITYVLSSYQGDTFFPNYELKDFKCVWYETKPGIILSQYKRVKL